MVVRRFVGEDTTGYNPRPMYGKPEQIRVLGWAHPSVEITVSGQEIGRVDYDLTLYAPTGAIGRRDHVTIGTKSFRVDHIANYDDAPPGWLVPHLDEIRLKEA